VTARGSGRSCRRLYRNISGRIDDISTAFLCGDHEA
jgi:hypothetical protein